MAGQVARRFLKAIFARVSRGVVEVRWSDGTESVFAGEDPGERAHIDIHDESRLASALVNDGSVGLGAAYIDGAWTTPDLAGFLEVASANVDAAQSSGLGSRTTRMIRQWWDLRPDFARSDAIDEIGDHYNLGNDFYAAWLDDSMTYSAGVFADGDDLARAQERKYERLADLLHLQEGDRVLEIGCGWGGFAEYAASRRDAHVTGLTLSHEMATFARKRLADAGLADHTDIKLQDFRDERDMYDKVVSIEMIESVDETVWAPLFHAIARAIPPGGKVAMQSIVIDQAFYENLLRRDDFIKRYIFPGGALPTPEVLRQLASDAGLVWVEHSSVGIDYARTLQLWAERFDQAWPEIREQDPAFDEPFRRMWQYYLEYCEAGFRTGRLDNLQILFERPAT